MHIVKSTLINP